MAEIKVSAAQLRTSAQTILNEGNKFNGLMNDISKEMQNMKNQWMGSAADSFISKFNALNKNFQAYFKVINDYGNFLNTSASEYEVAENKVTADQDAPLNAGNLFA